MKTIANTFLFFAILFLFLCYFLDPVYWLCPLTFSAMCFVFAIRLWPKRQKSLKELLALLDESVAKGEDITAISEEIRRRMAS